MTSKQTVEAAMDVHSKNMACGFLEWACTYYVTFNNKVWIKRFSGSGVVGEYISVDELYDKFISTL